MSSAQLERAGGPQSWNIPQGTQCQASRRSCLQCLCFKELPGLLGRSSTEMRCVPSLPAAHQRTDEGRTCLHFSDPANPGSICGAFIAQPPSGKTRVPVSLLSLPWPPRNNPPSLESTLPQSLSRLSSHMTPTPNPLQLFPGQSSSLPFLPHPRVLCLFPSTPAGTPVLPSKLQRLPLQDKGGNSVGPRAFSDPSKHLFPAPHPFSLQRHSATLRQCLPLGGGEERWGGWAGGPFDFNPHFHQEPKFRLRTKFANEVMHTVSPRDKLLGSEVTLS
ncbi:hypothetical protein HJG60_009929 [Phyllostomus discolor]|uniref:Uncharacterized protein n=1 Tax=Phyllostomus discolor TaxID=89673 RepID=A0A834B938_9CHIR|nr:hypothetical protein HJG60_009929 [Phyllostomus discolor]